MSKTAKRIPPAFGLIGPPRALLSSPDAVAFLDMTAEDFHDLHDRSKGPRWYTVAGRAFFDTSDLRAFSKKLVPSKMKIMVMRNDA